MKIELLDPVIISKNPTNVYVIEVKTMEGDADDYHSFDLYFDKNDIEEKENLRKNLICLEVLCKTLDHYIDYYSIPYYEELGLWENFHHDNVGNTDSYENHSIYYYDENGIKYNVNIEFDDEMNKEVSDFCGKKKK